MAAGVHGNVIQRNLVVGNPPLQVAIDHSPSTGFDIKNAGADDGTNTFTDNVCQTSMNAPCPAAAPSDNSVSQEKLQFVACGAYSPAASCQLAVNDWNNLLINKVNPKAQPLTVGDGSEQMTVQQYLRARDAAGFSRSEK
jgi:hypothetical protein